LDRSISGRVEIFLFSVEVKTISILLFSALESIEPPIEWVTQVVSRGVKQQVPPSNDEVKIEWI